MVIWAPTLWLPILQLLLAYGLGRNVALLPATQQLWPGYLSQMVGRGCESGYKGPRCVMTVDLGKCSLESRLLAHYWAAITIPGTCFWLYHCPVV